MREQYYFRDSELGMCDIKRQDKPLVINCVGCCNGKGPWKTDRTGRRDYYLQFMLDGRLMAYINGEATEFLPGSFIVWTTEKPYAYEAEDGQRAAYLWIHFSGHWAGALLAQLQIKTGQFYHTRLQGESTERLQQLFLTLFEEFTLRHIGFDEVATGLLQQILVLLVRNCEAVGREELPRLQTIFYIHQHFSEHLTVAQLALMEHMSPSRYRALFHRSTGCSPQEYILSVRMNHASQMLLETNRTVADVAADCGYKDEFYFMRLFKQRKGLTPGTFRKQAGWGQNRDS